MNEMYVRTYTRRKDEKQKQHKKRPYKRYPTVLAFDCETSADQFQNLKFGAFRVIQNGTINHEGIFYEPANLTPKEDDAIINHALKNGLSLYTREEFVNNVFYPMVYEQRALCIGYNLPFDLTRIASHIGEGIESNAGAFSVKLSDYKQYPRTMIRRKGGLTFMYFGGAFNYYTKKNKEYFVGHFLDLANIACVLAERKRLTLRKAGEIFDAAVKKSEADGHGKVTPEYIDYCRNDVAATYSLYEKIVKEYERYGIDLDICAAHSAAALGKAALKQLGIRPHNLQDKGFDHRLKDTIMQTYYGGRCELRYRRKPIKVTTLDFTSMYPTLSTSMNLWRFIIAKRIIAKPVAPRRITQMVRDLTLDRLTDRAVWPKLAVIVKIKPEKDCLPVRKPYKVDSRIRNIGINYLTYKGEVWYALPDVIASALETGKVPKIVSAIEFIPIGVQDTLRPATILGMKIDPRKEDFIKKIIEERQRIKALIPLETDPIKRRFLEAKQKALKILANSTTYGIFVEMHRVEEKTELLNVIDDSDLEVDIFEEEGEFYNPIVAVTQISGARLFLMMAEQKVKALGGRHVYMDTDSIAVPPNLAKPLQEFFQPLNPYANNIKILKIEKEDLWFYGISSKRYVLYSYDAKKIIIYEIQDENGDIDARGYMLHGLGHLKDPFNRKDDWHKEIWQDILEHHYGKITRNDLREKYQKYYALSSFTVNTPNLWARFKRYNEGKPWTAQIKPFNFFLIGVRANGAKPIAPFKQNSQEAVDEPFINHHTGEVLQGSEYWGDLWEVIGRYMTHPESKFENGDGDGWLERRHINADAIERTGKEVIDIEFQFLQRSPQPVYSTAKQRRDKILRMSEAQAADRGVDRRIFYKIKDTLRQGKKINWKRRAIQQLLAR